MHVYSEVEISTYATLIAFATVDLLLSDVLCTLSDIPAHHS